jgi:hypothetical protein
MMRFSTGVIALVLGLGLLPAHAERWLRSYENDPHKSGAYSWFDVDSIVHDKKSGLILAHAASAAIKAVRGGHVAQWTLWGVDCKGQKAYSIGAAGADGKFVANANWKTDPKMVVVFGPTGGNAAAGAIGGKVCAWLDAWPPGTMP